MFLAQYINYTVCSLHCQKCPAFFLPVLRHKDFFGWVTSLHGEKKMFPISFDYFNIIYFFKNFGVFHLN